MMEEISARGMKYFCSVPLKSMRTYLPFQIKCYVYQEQLKWKKLTLQCSHLQLNKNVIIGFKVLSFECLIYNKNKKFYNLFWHMNCIFCALYASRILSVFNDNEKYFCFSFIFLYSF